MGMGWIKAHRAWMENNIIWADPEFIAVWFFLNLSATHAERQADFGGDVITLRPGQLITGRQYIADHTGVNSSKVNRILKKFKSAHLIEQQTCTKGSLITLLNWNSEQKDEQQIGQPADNQRTTSGHLQEGEETKMKKCSKERSYGDCDDPSIERARALLRKGIFHE